MKIQWISTMNIVDFTIMKQHSYERENDHIIKTKSWMEIEIEVNKVEWKKKST